MVWVFFVNMANISDLDPELLSISNFKDCKDGSTIFNIVHCEENNVPHIVFNNIECVFRKSVSFSYLIFWESDKNKNMLNRYAQVIDEIKREILCFIDEYEDKIFIMGSDY